MGIDIFVAPDGDDAWSGRVDHPTPDGNDGPLATLEAAQCAARRLRSELERSGRPRGITIGLRGDHYRETPVRFTPEDSGSRDIPITYRSVGDRRARILGGRRITGWRERPDGAWTVTIPEVRSGEWYFRSLWMDGARRPRPCVPKGRTFAIDRNGRRMFNGFEYNPGEIDPQWKNLDDVEIVVVQFWTEARLRIQNIDEETRTVTFTGDSWRPLSWSKAWFAENVYEALEKPGEWYLDRQTGELTYLPLPGEDPEAVEAIAPVAETLVHMEGSRTDGSTVDHITFENLDLGYTYWEMPYPHGISIPQAEIPRKDGVVFAGNLPYGVDNPQVSVPVPATVYASRVTNCTFRGNEISHTGGWAIDLFDGCRDTTIERNHIHDIGAGAVRIGDPAPPDSPADVTLRTTVTNNRIHGGSRVYLGPAAVWIGQSAANVVSHNEIYDAFEWGISTGWNWNYWPPNSHRDNVIEYNHIHDLGDSHTGCHGAIYFLGVSPGTVCRGNLIHDIRGGCGIILDNACFGLLIENNVTYHTGAAGLCFNYNDSGNIVQNNIFALSESFAYERYGDLPATGNEKVDQTGILYRNIFYWQAGTFMRRSEWDNYDTLMNYNVYWDAAGKDVVFAGLDIEEWRKQGLDTDSLIADPLFADPENGDFSMPADSPAFKLGFQPIDTTRAGPRPSGPEDLPATPAISQ